MLNSNQLSNNPRVLVIGVRSEHAHMLKEMYSNMDFSFLTDNKKHTKPIKDGQYDKIVFMTDERNILRIVKLSMLLRTMTILR